MSAEQETKQPGFRGIGLAVAAAFIAGMVMLAVMNLPQGFDMDLGKIGTGKPAVVFVYDNNLSVSSQQTGEMNRIREGFSESLHFLVADVGRPQSREWIQKHQARSAEIFFFDASGQLRHRQSALLSGDQLSQVIEAILGVSG